MIPDSINALKPQCNAAKGMIFSWLIGRVVSRIFGCLDHISDVADGLNELLREPVIDLRAQVMVVRTHETGDQAQVIRRIRKAGTGTLTSGTTR